MALPPYVSVSDRVRQPSSAAEPKLGYFQTLRGDVRTRTRGWIRMSYEKVFVPYGAYWSTPFARWQGSLSQRHSLELAAEIGSAALASREIDPSDFDGLLLGITVPQNASFYGAPWVAGMIGAPTITGPTVSQACATSVSMLSIAAHEVECGQHESLLNIAADRTSNGPHIYYPDPSGPGGKGISEDPVWDNFGRDPWAGEAMSSTAENVASKEGISREEQDAMTLLRYEQYENALADGCAFQRRYMVPVELRRGRRIIGTLEQDEGVHPTSEDGLAKLRPVVEGGVVTFGSQTHPADGNAGLVVCTEERAKELSSDSGVSIRLRAFGTARVGKGLMPTAAVPAAQNALDAAGVTIEDCAGIKTHNPFAINDVYFCRQFGLQPEKVNRYGSSLIWGHPQAPTGLRAVIELIEELVLGGGGHGLFSGCAAGDSAMAVVVEVEC